MLPHQSSKSAPEPASLRQRQPQPAPTQPHLVDFVGFGERLADVQVRVPRWLSQRVVDVTWDRLCPDQPCWIRRDKNSKVGV